MNRLLFGFLMLPLLAACAPPAPQAGEVQSEPLSAEFIQRLGAIGIDVSPGVDMQVVEGLLDQRIGEIEVAPQSLSDVYPSRFWVQIVDRRIESAARDNSGLNAFVTASGFPLFLEANVNENLDNWKQILVDISWSQGGLSVEAGTAGFFIDESTIVTDAWAVTSQIGNISTQSPLVNEVDITLHDGQIITGQPNSIFQVGYDYYATVSLAEPAPIQRLPLSDLSSINTGDPIVTLGHPSTVGRWVASLGIVKQKIGYFDEQYPDETVDAVDTTNPFWAGMEGGPALNSDGEIVGIIRYGYVLEGLTSGGPGGVAPRPSSEALFPDSPYISQNLAMSVIDISAVVRNAGIPPRP